MKSKSSNSRPLDFTPDWLNEMIDYHISWVLKYTAELIQAAPFTDRPALFKQFQCRCESAFYSLQAQSNRNAKFWEAEHEHSNQ